MNHYKKYGFDIIFINDKDLLRKDWENICLSKIEENYV